MAPRPARRQLIRASRVKCRPSPQTTYSFVTAGDEYVARKSLGAYRQTSPPVSASRHTTAPRSVKTFFSAVQTNTRLPITAGEE